MSVFFNNIKHFFITIILFILIGVFIFYVFNLKFNITASMPLGIYQIQNITPKKGDLVIFKLSQNSEILLKRVVAVNGDFVKVNKNGVFINKKLLENSTIFKFDTKGNPLKNVNINTNLQQNEIFVMGDHEKSFDSRYFGIINTNDIKIQTVREIFTWKKDG
ncbi:signal peptidase I [Campylobacter fetus]|uniref:signal peptidase I n=1 Tax=Campylobacter fetus TaxID=196 RepID=UPI0006913F51|nr:signal peptidase I [Campylobacter fetus]OCS38168.1 conjugal transfer protein TraF [Campylobacter fetus subsp. venerealis]